MEFRERIDMERARIEKLPHQIGCTPLIAINLMVHGLARKVHLKLEGANPNGSMKDRTGYALIQDLEERGALHEGSVVIESTSGNLGVSLAFLCKARGYRFIAVVDPKITRENIAKMEALGAQIEMVHDYDSTGGYLLSRLKRVEELCSSSKEYVWTNQYANPANPLIHYITTGPEIYHQMNGKVDIVFVPVSTGGTLAGIAHFFREFSPSTRIIGIDAYGSVIFGSPPSPRRLTGIGSSQPSNFITQKLYDSYMLAGDAEAFAFCRAFFAATQMKIGGSSGATLSACFRYLAEYTEITDVVCVCADRGENYLSSIFNDEWLQQQALEGVINQTLSIQQFLKGVE